jgi:hypothetical protein
MAMAPSRQQPVLQLLREQLLPLRQALLQSPLLPPPASFRQLHSALLDDAADADWFGSKKNKTKRATGNVTFDRPSPTPSAVPINLRDHPNGIQDAEGTLGEDNESKIPYSQLKGGADGSGAVVANPYGAPPRKGAVQIIAPAIPLSVGTHAGPDPFRTAIAPEGVEAPVPIPGLDYDPTTSEGYQLIPQARAYRPDIIQPATSHPDLAHKGSGGGNAATGGNGNQGGGDEDGAVLNINTDIVEPVGELAGEERGHTARLGGPLTVAQDVENQAHYHHHVDRDNPFAG